MSVYFKDKEADKYKLSEYLKMDKSKCEYYLCPEKYRVARTEYIMDAIGDVYLEEQTYGLLLKQWQCSGGKYDVRTKKETFRGIYDIVQRFPFLTVDALDEIIFRYIFDLFKEYYLEDTLDMLLERFGKEDKTFTLFLGVVDQLAEDHHKQYLIEADEADKLKSDYSDKFVSYIKDLIIFQHYKLEDIKDCLPSADIVKKDEEQLQSIVESTRIYFGACDPISHQMFKSLISGEDLKYYSEQPQYVICGTKKVYTTFTKQEFLDSIKKSKSKILEIK